MRKAQLRMMSPSGDVLGETPLTEVQLPAAGEVPASPGTPRTNGMLELCRQVTAALAAEGLEPVEDSIGLRIELSRELLREEEDTNGDCVLSVQARQARPQVDDRPKPQPVVLDGAFLDDLFRLQSINGEELGDV